MATKLVLENVWLNNYTVLNKNYKCIFAHLYQKTVEHKISQEKHPVNTSDRYIKSNISVLH